MGSRIDPKTPSLRFSLHVCWLARLGIPQDHKGPYQNRDMLPEFTKVLQTYGVHSVLSLRQLGAENSVNPHYVCTDLRLLRHQLT